MAAGGTVVFPAQERTKDPAHWVDLVERHGVTLWNSVPQLAGLLADEATPDPARISTLRAVLMSGDWIPTTLPDRIRSLCPGAVVMSLGGATEGSIWSIWYEIGEVDPAWTSIPYGVAMPGQTMYVLNARGEHCPVGVTGEIHIGGAGVALNYWRDEELTRRRFFEHPVLGRLYRTGDLGRWSRQGYIEFLGRNDFQVKLNGYRVELGEIEHALTQYPGVTQSVAVVHERGGQILVGYYVSQTPLDTEQMRAFLAERLPEYMVPDTLVHLTELPLSPNGKLDRRALPEPEAPAAPEYVAPRTPREAQLRDLWAEVLGVPRQQLGIRDDLLRLGVDSIAAIRLVSRLRKQLGVAVGVGDVFAHRTIERFHDEVLRTAESTEAVSVRTEQGTLAGDVPLLPIQSWFFAQNFPRAHHWNQAFLIHTPHLDPERLRESLRAVVAQHDALRLRYHLDGGDVRQYYDPDAECPPLRVLDVRDLPAAEGTPEFGRELDRILTEWQSGFDLRHGPVLAAGYLHGYADGSSRVFLAAHHLVVDTVSWRVLAEDLRRAYEGESLGEKGTSYRQWGEFLAEYAQQRTEERSYWDTVSVPEPDVLLDPVRAPYETELEFDEDLTRQLLHECQRMFRTRANEFLLAAFAHALTALTGRPEHGVVLEGHGREDLADGIDVTRTVGWFTTLFPCRLVTADDPVETLKATKENLRAIPANGLGYGLLVGHDRSLPRVCFNYLGQVDGGDGDHWRITGERGGQAMHPDNVLPYTVNLAGMVVGGRLQFRLTSRLTPDDTERLARAFEASLTDLVRRTAGGSRTYLTSSDVDGVLPQEHLDRLQADREVEDVLTATGLQQGLVAHALRQGDVDDAYRVQAVWDYRAEIDPELLRRAWAHAQEGLASLRTSFDWQYELVQVVARHAPLHWRFVDLSGYTDPQQQERAFDELLRQDRETPYDMGQPGLFRVYLVKRGERHYTCLLNTHHAILDGWSSPLLLAVVHTAYLQLRDGEPLTPVADTHAACQRFLQRHAHDHDAFWRDYVRRAEESCDLTGLLRVERRNVDLATYRHVEVQGRRTLVLDAELLAQLRELCGGAGVTLNAVLQYAWHRLLATYGNCATTVVGTVLSGRDLPVEGIETAVGLYLSTVPLIMNHTRGTGVVLDEIRRLQQDIHEINSRSTVDLAALQSAGRRLFDSLFIYENYPAVTDSVHERELHPEFRFRHQKRDYPLVVTVTEQGDEVVLGLDFAEDLIHPATAERLLSGVDSVLKQLVRQPDLTVDHLQLADPTDLERQRRWNDTGAVTPEDPVIHRIFERHAAATPHATAVEHDGRRLTYAELNAAANRLARLLRRDGVRCGDPVLLLLDRDEHVVTSLLAVLKAGGVYVPLDPGYPDGRIARIVQGSGAGVVLTRLCHVDRIRRRWPALTVVALDDPQVEERIAAEPGENLELPLTGDEPAYILYTSGSTGVPKGVMVEHRAFTTTVEAVRSRHFAGRGALRTYSMTNYVFDIFGLEYGLTLLTGGSLVIGSPLAEGPDGTGLDFLQMTPSLLEMKLDGLRATEHLRLLVGGERLERHLLRAALPRFAEVVNVYGPTETTIWSTSKVYRGRLDETTPVTIGRALPGERAHVLDPDLRPLPVGAVGELYLSGSGLAREYVNDAELTARRFLPNPFHQPGDGHDRLYRTGDLVRWLETGELEFVGRVDNQVKLRGHRIELGEVENALVSFPGVRQAVARIVAPDPAAPAVAHRLVGYYVPGTGQDTLDEEALAAHLADVLPEHMRPDVLVRLTEIPLTYSGKLDVAALPVPERKNDRDHVPPRGELETVLAQVWQDVLGLERVGVHDRFFDLGGNSVLLTKVHGRLPEEIRRQVRLTDLFTHPTIAALSAYIAGQRAHTADVVRVGSSEPAGPGGVGSRDVAVIGMACRFPDADDVDEYWRNLTEGRNSIVHYSREELLAAGVPEAVLDQPGYVRAQSRLRDIRSFDAAFFGYSRREAEIMDPQHRLFLECAWHALEDAFCDPYRYEGAIGLFASVGQNNYLDDHVRPALAAADLSDEYQAMINNRADFLCTKVAYRLNLTGPAVTVQTACSSSLVAVHQACVALLAGDCDIALAGGVSIGKLGKEGYLYQEGMVFSPDGTCRAFDAGARGTVEGQGVGIVVLKPLERALADGDPIRAVIKGSAINNDGHDKVGYTAPSPRRQAAVIRSALRRAGVDPATISYIETHGTGTPLGDPIEFEGLMEVFGGTGARCALGAVKTNIGHLDVASGIAGLIKAVLCLEHRTLVPTLHYRTPNPRIDLEHSPFHVNTECRPWTGVDGVLRAGISSFGIGGTNAHVVLEAAPSVPPSGRRSDRAHQLLVVSGRTPEAVRRQSRRLADFLADNPGVPVERVAHTLLSARRRFEYSAVVVGRDRQELVQRLTAGDAGCVPGREGRPTVFLFPGQGTQYTGMGRALYESEPVFRAAVDECRALLRPHLPAGAAEEDLLGWTDRVNETRFTQPALFVLEYALARWFLAMGVRPDALIGHSLGEYVAACLAGVFSLDDALRLVCERGRLLDSTAPGAMLAVPLPVEGTLPHLQGEPLDVAVVNEHGSCVVAGEPDAVDRLAERLAADGVPSRRLAVTRAFHSRMLDPVLDEFTRVLEGIELHKPEIPFVSNLTGDWADPAEVTQPRYWVDQLRNQVAFAAGLDTLHDSAATRDAVLVELGPGQVLTRLARRHVRREGHPVVPAMPRAEHAEREPATLVEALGAVHAAGVDVDSQAFHGLFPGDRVRLPGYAFARVEHWLDRSGRSVAPAPESARVEPTTTSGSSLAAVVEQAWTSVLGVSRVQKDDDFFAQGGDSLAAVQFVTRIERALGVRVEFMELEQHTPAAVLRWLQEHTGAERHDRSRSVVRIRQGDPSVSPPLLLVHPIGGDVYFYRELAQCLPETQPVYAIRSPMLDGTAEFDTIEQMAASYVDMLGELGVTPPYRLGGASFGGIVAYEMAQQVGKRTGHWPDVVLIDSPAHGNLPEQMDERAILGYLARYGLTGLNFSVAELEALESAEERIRYLAARSRGTVFEELLSEEFLPVYLRTWRRHGEAMHRYVPSPYPGNIVFFSHQEVIPEFPTGQDRYWRRLARGKWRHVPVSGNHLSMTALPHVARIGAELAGLNWEEER
ncbi:MAG TPA: amino acid adenylation domain-containing protein [Pseudonocardiaceae bacterium]